MKTKTLLVISLAFIGLSAKAQKGLSVEVYAQPGLTQGGEFDVDKNNGGGNANYTPLDKKATIGVAAGVDVGQAGVTNDRDEQRSAQRREQRRLR